MFTLHHISYSHPNGDLLFDQLDLSILQKEKAALVGNNGVGKSTLLKIIGAEVLPTSGQVMLPVVSYLVPQIFGQFDHLTIAEALKVDRKIKGHRPSLTEMEQKKTLRYCKTIGPFRNDASRHSLPGNCMVLIWS